jgi:hypothetical protein
MQVEPAPGVFHAVGETIGRATELIQIEFRLAKAELAEKAARAGAGLSLVMVGAILATAALFLLLQPVAATLLVAVATMAIGFGFVMTGRKQLSAEALIPDRTLNDIQRDTALVKEKLT